MTKTIILKHQRLVRGKWEPVVSRFFDVSDRVNTETLNELFQDGMKTHHQIAFSVRPVRESPEALPHVEDVLTRINEFQAGIRRAINEFRNPKEADRLMKEAQESLRLWCEAIGLKLDWTERK